MEKLDAYNVVPGLEFLADNPEFLTEKIETLSDKCKAIYIPRAYIPKLLDFGIEHPDDERYPELLKVLGDVFEQSDDSARHADGQPISIRSVDPDNVDPLKLPHYDQRKHEYQAVSLAHQLQKEEEQVAILTDDNGLRALAASAHIPVIREKRQTYTGRRAITISQKNDCDINYENGIAMDNDKWQHMFPHEPALQPNEFIVFTQESSGKRHVMRYDTVANRLTPCHARRHRPAIISEISLRNIGQTILMEALLAPVKDIPIVIVQGDFGTGKTFLTTAIAYAGVESQQYDQIVICPRDSRLGDDIGAVPGDTSEKTATKAHSVIDNLREVLRITRQKSSISLDKLTEQYLEQHCSLTPLVQVGGRSLTRSFIICDEFQDMSRQQARAVMTRIGEGSKLVVMGDLSQINNPHLTQTSCGLAYAIKRLAGKPEIAFVNLTTDEIIRSPAATALAKYL